jgi:hypothetical protein
VAAIEAVDDDDPEDRLLERTSTLVHDPAAPARLPALADFAAGNFGASREGRRR